MDFAPQITSVLHLGDFHLVPSFTVDETFYGDTQGPYQEGFVQVLPASYLRSAREFKMDLIMPSFARVFNRKSWLGDKLKHVIEPRATYEYVTGIGRILIRLSVSTRRISCRIPTRLPFLWPTAYTPSAATT